MRNVLIADDHEVTRRGVCELLRENFDGVDIVEAADTGTVLAHLPSRAWDLIVLDIMMPGGNVVDTISKIRASYEAVPILVLTAASEIGYVIETMKAGANGLSYKHRPVDELLAAIKRVANGGTYLHAETAIEIATTLRKVKTTLPHDELSERELEIFRLIALGRAVKEIASDLAISDKTVATYLGRIREKTGLTSHVDIARYALRHGLVD